MNILCQAALRPVLFCSGSLAFGPESDSSGASLDGDLVPLVVAPTVTSVSVCNMVGDLDSASECFFSDDFWESEFIEDKSACDGLDIFSFLAGGGELLLLLAPVISGLVVKKSDIFFCFPKEKKVALNEGCMLEGFNENLNSANTGQ